MKTVTTDTLIIGAGPAGLATAMELARAQKDFLVIERQPTVGGLAKTYTFKEGKLTFYTDNGPHRFFSKNQYLYDFIEDLLDEKWIKVRRQTRQHIDGKFYDYPVNAPQALRNLGPFKTVHILFDYGIAKIRYGLLHKPIESFYDYTVANFGRTLGEFNMLNYTEKIWGISTKELHADWAGQRIKGLSLTSLAKDALLRPFRKQGANKPKSLVDAFYYPDMGTGLIYQTIVDRITKQGYKIMLETSPVEVHHNGKRITEVIAEGPEGRLRIKCKNLVESVPMKEFVQLLAPVAPKSVTRANDKLRYRSQVYLFITLNKKSITPDQWIYFPDRDVPIARSSEMRNFSKNMSPAGKTSLFIEFFCFEGDELWNMSAKELFELALAHYEKIGFFKRKDVRKYYKLRERNVYPIYDLNYKNYLAKIKPYLDSFENLLYIGRPGRFRYNNQDHSLEMGIMAAKSIIDKKRYDIEAVGSEKEYYEAGNLHEGKKNYKVQYGTARS